MVQKRYLLLLVVVLMLAILNLGSFLFIQGGSASASSVGTTITSDDCVSLVCPPENTPSLTP